MSEKYLCHYNLKSIAKRAREKFDNEKKLSDANKRYIDLMNDYYQAAYGFDYYPNGNVLMRLVAITYDGKPVYGTNPDDNIEELYNNRAKLRISKIEKQTAAVKDNLKDAIAKRKKERAISNNPYATGNYTVNQTYLGSTSNKRKIDANSKKQNQNNPNAEPTPYGGSAAAFKRKEEELKKQKKKNFNNAQNKAAASGHTVYHSDTLSHHGINGQKWGVRRFQNPDGSLTPAGKRRYSEMSDEEIMTKSRRLQAEENLYNLEKRAYERENPEPPKQEESLGKKVAKDLFQSLVYKPLLGAGESYMKAAYKAGIVYTAQTLSSGKRFDGSQFVKTMFSTDGKSDDKKKKDKD